MSRITVLLTLVALELIAAQSTALAARKPSPSPTPSQTPLAVDTTPLARDLFYFEGEFDYTRVRFTGDTLINLFKDCMNYAIDSRVAQFVDSISIGGRVYSKFIGHWNPDTVCAVAALNAQNDAAQSTILLQANIEKLPLKIYQHSKTQMAEVLDTLIPALVSSFEVDRFRIWGKEFKLIPGSYTADALTGVLLYSVRPDRGEYTAGGTIEGWTQALPFHFTGNTSSQIRSQCLDYFQRVQYDLDRIHAFTVNGKKFDRAGWGYWNPADVCMTIYTLFPR